MQQCNCCCVRCVESQMHTMPVCGPGRCVQERRRDKNSIQIQHRESRTEGVAAAPTSRALYDLHRVGGGGGEVSRRGPRRSGSFFPLFTVFLCGRYKDWDKKKENATKLQGTNLKIPFLIRSHQSRRAK